MIDLRVGATPLVVAPDTTADIEHLNSLFADGIEDSFSLPFTLPAEPNALPLKHAQVLALKDRIIRFPGSSFGHQGIPLYPGTLKVLGSTPTQLDAHFVVDDFTTVVRNVRLRDTLQGQVRDLLADLLNGIEYHTRPLYADGGDFQFPMHVNTALYGNANPDWQPEASEWNASSSYLVNAVVTHYVEEHGVRRPAYWQCISPCPPGEGEPPINPTRWKLLSLGIPNQWDRTIGEFSLNTSDGNFYAMVPWYYLKWVLAKAMEHLGWTVRGTFMTDTRTHELLLPNATTIDRPNNIDSLRFFQATSTSDQNYTASSGSDGQSIRQMVWAFQDESSGSNQDANNLWDNSAFEFTPNAAGVWQFRARWKTENVYDGQFVGTYGQVVRMYLLDSSNNIKSAPTGVFNNGSNPKSWAYIGQGAYNPLPSETEVDVTGTYSFAPGDVGQTFRIILVRFTHSSNSYGVDIRVWPVPNGVLGAGSVLSAWSTDLVGTSVPDQYVTAARHVPDVSVGELLVAVQSACNLRLLADMQKRILYLEKKATRPHLMHGAPVERSPRLLNPPALDHQRRKPGIRLHWDLADTTSGPMAFNSGIAHLESDLPAPVALRLRALVTSSRKVFESRFLDGEFYWEHNGYHVPDAITGDPDTAETFTPSCKPLHMTQISVDGRYYLVPVLEHEGTSAYFGNDAAFTDILLCDFRRITDYSEAETDVPSATSWGAVVDPDDDSGANLLWQDNGAPGLYTTCFQAWHEFLVSSEPVNMDLLVDHPFLLNRDWERPFTAQGQVFLIERLPVTYAGQGAPLIAAGAKAWRIVPPIPTSIPDA